MRQGPTSLWCDLQFKSPVGLYRKSTTGYHEFANPVEGPALFWAPIATVTITTGVGAVWALWNRPTNTKSIYIRRIVLNANYTGGGRTNTTGSALWERRKLAAAQVVTGIAAVTPVGRASGAISQITAGDCCIGDATTAITFGAGASIETVTSFKYACDTCTETLTEYHFAGQDGLGEEDLLELSPSASAGGQALVLDGGVNSSSFTGFVQWEESAAR